MPNLPFFPAQRKKTPRARFSSRTFVLILSVARMMRVADEKLKNIYPSNLPAHGKESARNPAAKVESRCIAVIFPLCGRSRALFRARQSALTLYTDENRELLFGRRAVRHPRLYRTFFEALAEPLFFTCQLLHELEFRIIISLVAKTANMG